MPTHNADDNDDEEVGLTDVENKQKRKSDSFEASNRKRFHSGDSGYNDKVPPDDLFEEPGEDRIATPSKDVEQKNKLDLILEELKVLKAEMKNLTSSRADDKSEIEGGVQNSPEVADTLMLLENSRSMEDIEGIGFEYEAENEKVKCKLCENQNYVNKTPTNSNSSG